MNKTIVITGASAGIGRALAQECFRRGYHLGLTGRRMEALEALRDELLATSSHDHRRIELITLDVDRSDTVAPVLQSLFERLGGVNIVVVNAGINEYSKVGQGNLDKELQVLQTNLIGGIATINAAAEYFLGKDGGQIVGISSLASLKGMPTQGAYCASKAGFSMYLDSARIELRHRNIHVTKILPGFILTDIMPNMEKFPFAVTADKAAREILQLIEKRKEFGVVPGYPWRILRPLIPHIPDWLWKKLM